MVLGRLAVGRPGLHALIPGQPLLRERDSQAPLRLAEVEFVNVRESLHNDALVGTTKWLKKLNFQTSLDQNVVFAWRVETIGK